MGRRAFESARLEEFRDVWVLQRRDYQRAADTLRSAIQAAEAARGKHGVSKDERLARHTDRYVAVAEQQLDETRIALEAQFERFCAGFLG